MQILLDTQLMPQYLPGASASAAWSQLEMAPAADGQVLLFTIDADHRFTLWLSGTGSTTTWCCVQPTLAGCEHPRVLNMALFHNSGQGRLDGTIDLGLIADVGDGVTPDRRWLVWHGLASSSDPQVWAQRLATAVPQPSAGLDPERMHWGQATRPYRSRCLQGRQPDGSLALWWQRFDDGGQPVQEVLEPMPPGTPADSGLTIACITALDDQGTSREGYARSLVSERERRGHMTLVWPEHDRRPRHECPLPALNGSLQGWGPSEGMWPLTHQPNATWVYFDTDRNDGGVIEASFNAPEVTPTVATVAAAVVPGRVRALVQQGNAAGVVRLELTQSDKTTGLLRLTRSSTHDGGGGRSTLMEAEVSAFTVCECFTEHSSLTVLHVLVGFRAGGLWLLSQDSVSGLWCRSPVANDDVSGGLHTSTSYTTRIRVLDDSSAPVVNAAVRLRPQSPCSGFLNGQATHLSPLAPTVASTSSGGEVTFIQTVSSLGAVQIDVEVVETPDGLPLPPGLVRAGSQRDALRASTAVHRVQLNPMTDVAIRLGAVGSGLNLQQVKASDGTQPFAHLPLDTCNQAFDAMTPLLNAYHATLQPPTTLGAARVVARRTHLRWKGGALSVTEESLATPEALGDIFDSIGDILGFLWTAVADAMHDVEVVISWLADGLCAVAVAIGEVMWTGVVAIASQAADLIDWALQKTLGVSIKDIVHWLGEVFDWASVQQNQVVMQKLLTLSLDAAQQWLSNDAPALVHSHRAEAGRWLTEGLPDLDDKAREMLSKPPLSGTPDNTPGARETASPSTSWVHQKFTDYAAQGSGGAAGDFAAAEDALQLVLELGADMEKLVGDLVDYFSTTDWQQQSALSVLENVAGRIGSDLLDLIDHFVVNVLKIIADLVKAIRDVLNARMEIPVLTPLYEKTLGLGTFSLSGGVTLGASLAALTTSRLVAGKDFITPELRQRVLAATSLRELLETDPGDSAADVNAAARAAVATLTATLRTVYAAAWFIDQFTPPLPPAQRNRLVPSIKCSMDCAAWLMSIVMASTFCKTSRPGPGREFATCNVSNQFFGLITSRFRDVYELRQLQQAKVMDPTITKYLDCIEASAGTAGYFLTSVLMVREGLDYQDSVNLTDDEKAQWQAELWLPVTQSFVTAVYTVLVARSQMTNPELSEGMRIGRMVSNALRSVVLPWCQAGTLIDSAAKGWKVPGSVGS